MTDREYPAERTKAFVDAVVAIAMTLLILPLMESVSEFTGSGALPWLHEHAAQLSSFVVSFVIIGMFWINHHRLFARVEKVTSGLLWIQLMWLLSIVWLPVATALSGRMSDEDPFVKIVYIGSMILTSLLTVATRVFLLRRPALVGDAPEAIRQGIAVDLAMATLFGVALLLSLLFPVLSYWPMFVMFLSPTMQRLYGRMLRAAG